MKRVMLFVLTLALGVMLLPSTSQVVQAQSPWLKTMQTWMVDMANFRGYTKAGYVINHNIVVGQFPRGLVPAQRVQFTLNTGYRYVFLARCDESCFDLSLELYDPTNRLIRESVISDGVTALDYVPELPGTYSIVAKALRCAAQAGLSCNWGYGVLEAPTR